MAIKLRGIVNNTSFAAVLTNTEHAHDKTNIPVSPFVHTGGKDGDYIRIPDCSAYNHYDRHHILIEAEGSKDPKHPEAWTVSLWNDDNEGHLLYWNSSNTYSKGHPIHNSDDKTDCVLIIADEGGTLTVTANCW